jgi:hypothetical protein
MALRIAFDIDGVLADMDGALRREASRLGIRSGEVVVQEADVSSASSDPTTLIVPKGSDGDQRRLWAEVTTIENFWGTLDEIEPGSIRRLDTLATERRWEVLFITTRPPTAGETVQRQSQRWLERHGFRFPSVYVVRGSRGKVASALDLDIVVDDRPENCIDVKADSQARAILVSPRDVQTPAGQARPRLDERALHLDIGVVQSVRECLDLLEALEFSDDGKRGSTRRHLMRRLAQRLGLSAKASGSES